MDFWEEDTEEVDLVRIGSSGWQRRMGDLLKENGNSPSCEGRQF